MSQTIERAQDGYDRTKNPRMIRFRPMLPAEARALSYGDHVKFLARDGTIRNLKINGKPKTWKRDLERLEIPVKYGMYECAYFVARNGRMESWDLPGVILVAEVPDEN